MFLCIRYIFRRSIFDIRLRNMKTIEQAEFLNLKLVPARLNAIQAAWFLGFEPHEITILVGAGV